MYRFLATPRWLGLAAIAIAMAATMVFLGRWQLHRYQERDAINTRIDATATQAPVPLAEALPPPAAGGGPAPAAGTEWRRVTVTGKYDAAHEILARGRTVDGNVGFEVVTPLRLADGSAILVDRGWVPPSDAGAAAPPEVPPAPGDQVTVVGRIHLSESGGRAVERTAMAGAQVRRIGVPFIARELPYPVYGAYLLADPVESGFTAIPAEHENAWQNAGYVVQWWLLAGLTLFSFGYLARREAQTRSGVRPPRSAFDFDAELAADPDEDPVASPAVDPARS